MVRESFSPDRTTQTHMIKSNFEGLSCIQTEASWSNSHIESKGALAGLGPRLDSNQSWSIIKDETIRWEPKVLFVACHKHEASSTINSIDEDKMSSEFNYKVDDKQKVWNWFWPINVYIHKGSHTVALNLGSWWPYLHLLSDKEEYMHAFRCAHASMLHCELKLAQGGCYWRYTVTVNKWKTLVHFTAVYMCVCVCVREKSCSATLGVQSFWQGAGRVAADQPCSELITLEHNRVTSDSVNVFVC